MAAFAPILKRALKRTGGQDKLEAQLPSPRSADELAAVPDDRYLSQMCLRVFRAGLKHSLVDSKWPAFEEAFHGFQPGRVTLMSDEDMEACMGNAALIRHWAKLSSIRDNAAAMQGIAREHGSFGQWLAAWPADDTVGLWAALARDFSQLGGNSGPYFLRMVGKDTFVLTDDVSRALIDAGIVEKKPTGKADKAKVQKAFNGWAAETGRPLCQLSRILAFSVG
ncbi:MAG TPA: DNA-3-methyladenine glycosylase I [Afifellaceae bacterium]|nr:DNA-3-methyladenine glycosylase I [Afifellaceae bacterium]